MCLAGSKGRIDTGMPALFPQPLAEGAGREEKKLLEDLPDLVP